MNVSIESLPTVWEQAYCMRKVKCLCNVKELAVLNFQMTTARCLSAGREKPNPFQPIVSEASDLGRETKAMVTIW